MTRGQSSVAMQIEDVYGNATVTEFDQATKRQKLESLNNVETVALLWLNKLWQDLLSRPAKCYEVPLLELSRD
ncbi:hypothetical protein A2U01_0043098, partial [Trifolium medium]|nr:hypothetical protein [Trifolium medium]